jgi:uncharacterized protein YhfF
MSLDMGIAVNRTTQCSAEGYDPRCGVSRRTVPAKAASEEKDMEAELRRVLEAAYPGEQARYFLPISIGSTPEAADGGAALILNGTKTLTSSPFWDYPDGKIPFVGALAVLLDGSRRPRGIVETTRVEIMPFGAITEEMAWAYGEGERTSPTTPRSYGKGSPWSTASEAIRRSMTDLLACWLSSSARDTHVCARCALLCPNHHRAVHRCDAPFDFKEMAFLFSGRPERLAFLRHELSA